MTGMPERPAGYAWGHDELANDLAMHLRHGGQRRTWTNFAVDGASGVRPDVFSLVPFTYQNPQMTAWEVKVSVSDFRSDVTSGKWQEYLRIAQGVTFAVPHGLVALKDIPAGAGLIVRSERAWRHVRKPTFQRVELPLPFMLKLLSCRFDRDHDKRNTYDTPQTHAERNDRDDMRRRAKEHAMRAIGQRYGVGVAKFLRREDQADSIIPEAEAKAEAILADARRDAAAEASRLDAMRQEMAAAVGLPPDTDTFSVTWAWGEARRRLSASAEVEAIHLALQNARRGLDEVSRLIDAGKNTSGTRDAAVTSLSRESVCGDRTCTFTVVEPGPHARQEMT